MTPRMSCSAKSTRRIEDKPVSWSVRHASSPAGSSAAGAGSPDRLSERDFWETACHPGTQGCARKPFPRRYAGGPSRWAPYRTRGSFVGRRAYAEGLSTIRVKTMAIPSTR